MKKTEETRAVATAQKPPVKVDLATKTVCIGEESAPLTHVLAVLVAIGEFSIADIREDLRAGVEAVLPDVKCSN